MKKKAMEVEIISTETITPSSSPPSLHLKFFKLSLLDQLSPFTYTSLVFFYALDATHDDLLLSDGLKTSLSKALTEFYLLAGAVENNTEILGNGVGALFQTARVHGAMLEFLKQSSFESLSRLIPYQSVPSLSTKEAIHPQVAVQLNTFSGGGVAVGACFLHKIIDGTTLSCFLRRWAAAARGFVEEEQPEYAAALFPQRGLSAGNSWLSKGYSPFVGGGRICRRRFGFEGGAILELKEEAKSESVKNPTGVEVVTGFIWKHAIRAATQRSGSQQPSVLTHAVDLRRRMAPPLPPTSMGNLFWSAVAYYDSSNTDIELRELVSLLRRSFVDIDDKFIEKMAGEDGFQAISNWFIRMQELFSSKPYAYGFTSWRNLGLNDVDFGWGKPSWVSFAGPENSVLRNIVVLKEAILGDGIEAWILLDEDEMNILENDQQFLAFASLNPIIHLA
ncbi:vinorine synthase-like [Momordica charantia]|uniref:Vinorine synthase-like n=1 Tax=Momordica charantia TaxID=3673 RepID=A0A6J1CVW8_MOMCH|nr:vinorine synthase-like [Momordica charantia]